MSILGFTILPMILSLIYSFCDYDVLTPMKFIGLGNYIKMFTPEPYGVWEGFSNSLRITFVYAIISVPMSLILSFLLAVFANRKLRGMAVYRVLFYIPVLIPAVVSALLWSDILDVDFGFINLLMHRFGKEGFDDFLMVEDPAYQSSIYSVSGEPNQLILYVLTGVISSAQTHSVTLLAEFEGLNGTPIAKSYTLTIGSADAVGEWTVS